MKEQAELEAMTKAELQGYAKAELELEVSQDLTKGEMLTKIAEHAAAADDGGRGGQASQEGDGEGDGEPAAPDDGMVSVTITSFHGGPDVPLMVNGRAFSIRVGKPCRVPRYVIDALANVEDLDFTVN